MHLRGGVSCDEVLWGTVAAVGCCGVRRGAVGCGRVRWVRWMLWQGAASMLRAVGAVKVVGGRLGGYGGWCAWVG